MSAVLLSVKPSFAHRLLSGHKTAEVRRRFPSVPSDTIVYIYASTPERKVIGAFRLSAVSKDTPEALWKRFEEHLDISNEYFNEYLDGCVEAAVIELQLTESWERTVTLEELRTEIGVQPPQSFRYLDSTQENRLRRIAQEV